MAKEDLIVGLDVGTTTTRVVVAVRSPENEKPSVVGIGVVPSSGIQKGVVTDVEETIQSVSSALDRAEQMAGSPIEHATVSIGGAHISSQNSRGVIAVSRADGEISEDDITRVINAAQAISIPSNREILHVVPQQFVVDSQDGITDPLGMTGVRLEVDAHIIEGSAPFIKNLTKCVYQAGVTVEDLVYAPLSAAKAVLSKRQRELGVILIDLGGGTTNIAVFEENRLLQTATLPIGSMHITNDIAIGLRSSIDVAEKIKVELGTAIPDEVKKTQIINLKHMDEQEEETEIPRRHVAEIIEARLAEIFLMVNKELKMVQRSGLLPAGVVLTGGGAKMHGVVELAKKELRLPAQLGYPQPLPGIVDEIYDPAWATAVGLIFHTMDTHQSKPSSKMPNLSSVGPTVTKIRGWFRSLMP
ncbi:MAG: cell division protein FtsA [bacterium]|nr:cell division protein FtsA [bacterium]